MGAAILHSEHGALGATFEVVRGNLLEEPVDALVNAANGRLAHGGPGHRPAPGGRGRISGRDRH